MCDSILGTTTIRSIGLVLSHFIDIVIGHGDKQRTRKKEKSCSQTDRQTVGTKKGGGKEKRKCYKGGGCQYIECI